MSCHRPHRCQRVLGLVATTLALGLGARVANTQEPTTSSPAEPTTAAATSAAPEPTFDWPLPPPLERPPQERAGETGVEGDDALPSYYTAPLAPILPGLRAVPSFGLGIDGSIEPHFALDIAASVRARLHRGYSYWALWPELGYTVVAPTTPLGHELGVGLGLGRVFDELAALRWTPWLIVDVSDAEALGLGVRNRLTASLMDLLSVELSHQWLAFDQGSHHDLRLGVGLDVLVLVLRAAYGEGLEP